MMEASHSGPPPTSPMPRPRMMSSVTEPGPAAASASATTTNPPSMNNRAAPPLPPTPVLIANKTSTNVVSGKPGATTTTAKTSSTSASRRSNMTIRSVQAATANLLCQRQNRKCTRNAIEGQSFCVRHVNELHRESRFRRCNYSSSRTGRRCANILLRHDSKTSKEGFCEEHLRLVTKVRRTAAERNRMRASVKSVATSIAHYRTQEPDSCSVELPGRLPLARTGQRVLGWSDEYSQSSDDDDGLLHEPVGDRHVLADEDHVPIDTASDPLRHAGVFTHEEIVLQTREKLIRLQSLYQEQCRVLRHKYEMRRAKYEQAVAALDQQGSAGVSTDSRHNDDTEDLLGVPTRSQLQARRRLQALASYRRRQGVHCLLNMHRTRKRKLAADIQPDDEEMVQCEYLPPATEAPTQKAQVDNEERPAENAPVVVEPEQSRTDQEPPDTEEPTPVQEGEANGSKTTRVPAAPEASPSVGQQRQQCEPNAAHQPQPRCSQPVVPRSKYCRRHVLHDASQQLFAPCAHAECPAVLLCAREDAPRCLLHTVDPWLAQAQAEAALKAEAELSGLMDVVDEPDSGAASPESVQTESAESKPDDVDCQTELLLAEAEPSDGQLPHDGSAAQTEPSTAAGQHRAPPPQTDGQTQPTDRTVAQVHTTTALEAPNCVAVSSSETIAAINSETENAAAVNLDAENVAATTKGTENATDITQEAENSDSVT